jgi:hypothetical protein
MSKNIPLFCKNITLTLNNLWIEFEMTIDIMVPKIYKSF